MKTPSPKVELEFELPIDLSMITHKGLQHMLRTALAQTKDRQLPLHKRGEQEVEEADDDTDEADMERTKLADLHASRGEPAPIPTTDEDLPESVADKLPKKAKRIKKA